MTFVITGGAGFIGTTLIRALQTSAEPPEIIVLDNLHPQVHGEAPTLPDYFNDGSVRLIRGDVADPNAWQRLLADVTPTAIVHLAAETGTGQSLLEASRHTNVNVNGTAVMLDALAEKNRIPERIVLASSRAVYGEGRWRDPADGAFFYPAPRGFAQLEHHEWEPVSPSGMPAELTAHEAATVEPRPTNVYAATKLAQEHILTAWSSALGADLTVLRLQNVYGAGQAVGNPYTGVLTYFARELSAGRPISVYEGGGIVRDFVHVADVVSAILAVLGLTAEPGAMRTFDIGSGGHGTLLEYAEILARTAGGGDFAVTQQYRLGDVRGAYADISAAVSGLGYVPRVPFEEGAVRMLEWVAQQ